MLRRTLVKLIQRGPKRAVQRSKGNEREELTQVKLVGVL